MLRRRIEQSLPTGEGHGRVRSSGQQVRHCRGDRRRKIAQHLDTSRHPLQGGAKTLQRLFSRLHCPEMYTNGAAPQNVEWTVQSTADGLERCECAALRPDTLGDLRVHLLLVLVEISIGEQRVQGIEWEALGQR